MKRKILLASDLDNTLLFPQTVQGEKVFVFSQEDAEAIRAFRRAGHYFALCTGRTPNSIKRVLHDFPDMEPDGLILASGGALFEVAARFPLELRQRELHLIPAKAAAECIRFIHDTGKFSVYWSTPEVSYGLAERSPLAEKTHRLSLIPLEDWCARPEDVISMGLSPLSRDVQDTLEAIEAIETRWPSAMRPFRNTIYIDISAAHVDKGKGLARMAELLGDITRYCAVGDAHNDLPMFAAAGKDHSFLLENGEADLAPYVKKRVRSVADCIGELLKLYP